MNRIFELECNFKTSPCALLQELPTFLYAMPFTRTKIFFEETSLVARPAVGFDDLKERLEARLKWLGIKVCGLEKLFEFKSNF